MVSQVINYDLLKTVDEMYVMCDVFEFCSSLYLSSEQGMRQAPDLLPADYKGGRQDSGSL